MPFGDPNSPTELAQTVIATTAAASKTVNPHRAYTLIHLGDKGEGTATLEAVFLAFDVAVVTADTTAEENKAVLMAGDGGAGVVGGHGVIQLPPGITTISYKTATANVAFQIIAGPWLFGDF